ncbi:hypothetical protein ACO2Q8_11215 [Larkinella sp. VNQ87]|uniref:hypothetical protein n=1 Tax=Larkinella sp. VNQ87 TaxID=3400921 RepID=UPI003C10DA5E
MELFFTYDIERLRCYAGVAGNADKISVESHASHLLLSFTDVGYFNYCVCHEPAQLDDVLEHAQTFYASRQIDHHKLLVDEALSQDDHYRFLTNQGYVLKERLMAVQDPIRRLRPMPATANLQLEPVCGQTIAAFTEDYLTAFESEQKNPKTVVTNFRQLLGRPNLGLFRVTNGSDPVGIAVLYGSDGHFFLAGGAILPTFRNNGYHTTALVTRLNWSNAQNARSVISWAYEGGASYRNMLRVGLLPYKCYRVYER